VDSRISFDLVLISRLSAEIIIIIINIIIIIIIIIIRRIFTEFHQNQKSMCVVIRLVLALI